MKPILLFWVDMPRVKTVSEVQEQMQYLQRYIEQQRVNDNDFDFFVLPRPQDIPIDVQILNPVPVTEEAYIRLKKYAQDMLDGAFEKYIK